MTPTTAKKIPKSTKISAFNNSNLSSAVGKQQPDQVSSLSQSSDSSVNSNNKEKSYRDNHRDQAYVIDEMFNNGNFLSIQIQR